MTRMGNRNRSFDLLLLAALLAVAVIIGCAPAGRKAPPAPSGRTPTAEKPADEREPSGLVHTVRWKGESLSIIAKWYTGDMNLWKALAEQNPLSDPNRIRIGDRISISEDLLRTRDPLPRAFVEKHAAKPKPVESPQEETLQQAPPKGGAPPEPEDRKDAPELFGPKELKKE